MTHVGTKGDRMPHHCGNQGLAIGSTLVYRSAVFPGGIIKIKSVKFPLAKLSLIHI